MAFAVTYSDGTTGTVASTVSAVLNSFATNLLPNCTAGSTSTTPTFTWTYPSNPTNYTYQFNLCCSNNGTIWQIPGNNSNSNGFSISQIPMPAGLAWDTAGDSEDGNSLANIPSLTLGTNYTWQIQVSDSNGNQAVTMVGYQP